MLHYIIYKENRRPVTELPTRNEKLRWDIFGRQSVTPSYLDCWITQYLNQPATHVHVFTEIVPITLVTFLPNAQIFADM